MKAFRMKLKINRSATLEELIRGCRKNNSLAQRELFDRYSSRMLGICRRYVGNLADAEDIMVNAFMKIFDKIDQYAGSGNFEGWMSRIMVNESLTYIRRNRNMSVEVSIEQASFEPDYSAILDPMEAEQLLQWIDNMPVGYRTVFNLYVLEGYAHKEIAEMLDISEGASKSQLSRAKAYLRNKIYHMDQELKNKHHER
jgi:RNA polymerase sigma factor (sigma-70 family)